METYSVVDSEYPPDDDRSLIAQESEVMHKRAIELYSNIAQQPICHKSPNTVAVPR